MGGGAKHTEVRGVRTVFRGGSPREVLPPPSFLPPFFGALWGLMHTDKPRGPQSSKHKKHYMQKTMLGESIFGLIALGCTPKGSCHNTFLRRVLRRFSNSKCFFEGFFEGA